MKRIINRTTGIVAILLVGAFIYSPAVQADTFDWDGGGTGDDWGTDGNWNLAGEPSATDDAKISNGGTAQVTQLNEVCNTLNLGVSDGQSGTLVMSTGSSLSLTGEEIIGRSGTGAFTQNGGTHSVGTYFRMGYNTTGSGNYSLMGGSLSAPRAYIGLNGTGVLTQSGGTNTVSLYLYVGQNANSSGTYNLEEGNLSASYAYIGATGTGIFTQSGGTNMVGTRLYVGHNANSSGTYNLEGGNLSASRAYIGSSGTGTVTQSGGTHTLSPNHLYLGENANSRGTYNLEGGNLSTSNAYIGVTGTGVFTQSGGTNTVDTYIYLGQNANSSGTYNLQGGTLAGTANLRVRNNAASSGTFRGYGTVDLSGPLYNNGRVIADGDGVDRTLGLTNVHSVANTIENMTTNGWFAQNGGKLALPTINVSGDVIRNWGETSSDTDIDLVNSVRMVFSGGVSGGDLAVALLARDRTDVVANDPTVIGLWNFDTSGGFTFGGGNATLTFRYDDALAASLSIDKADLKVWHDGGTGNWTDVTASNNTTANTITTSAVTSFSNFAVSKERPLLPKGTIILIK